MPKPIDMITGFSPTRREVQDEQGWTIHVTPPAIAGTLPTVTVNLTHDQYRRYLEWRHAGMLIQDALPELTPAQREMLITGLGDADFYRFAKDDDDDTA